MAADIDVILKAAEQMSGMADKVAGFAISSDLLLVFASLKDLSQWVTSKTSAFLIGTALSFPIYTAVVWFLYIQETRLEGSMSVSAVTIQFAQCAALVLAWARTLGILGFTIVLLLAIVGASKGVGKGPAK